MHIINIDRITVNFAGREIFNDLSWAIDSKDRVGLIGPNGAGKSTLLRVLAGQIPVESGAVTKYGKIRIGYLEQDIHLPEGQTVWDVVSVLPLRLREVENDLNRIEARMADPDVYNDEKKLNRVMEQQEAVLVEYDRLGIGNFDNAVRRVLNSLGFDEDMLFADVSALSGGQKKLLAVARLALESPEVLLLDEPDNHLDITAKHHLEAFIHGYNGAVVIVSHDRYLLDDVVTHIAELETGKLTLYVGNYSKYTTERELARLRQEQAYVTQQKQIAKIEAAIARFELWASMVVDERHIKQARSRRKMLDRMEANGEIIEKVQERKLMNLQMAGKRGSKKALEVKGVSVAFDDDFVLLDVDMLIRHGERVGLIGANGAGKSVLFKTVLGEITPLDGEVTIGNSTSVGYYAQEHQTLDAFLQRTPIELVQELAPMSEGTAVARLLAFAFKYEQTRQPIGTMSGGERSRLQLMRLMLQQPNLLLLDEPTNNLDIASVEVLETALEDFEGAVLTISHDRYFLDRVVDRVVELRDGQLTEYAGGYTDYVERRRVQA
ncbi:MAG: ABC-F family ATP-binding cassette domain-containing protein [Chloroflexota bacterium]